MNYITGKAALITTSGSGFIDSGSHVISHKLGVLTPTQIYKGTTAGQNRIFSLNAAGWSYDWYVDPRGDNGVCSILQMCIT